ncbi:trypsin-like peptidase domain-containing protein [Rothia sp. LK2588]|uniref:S1C family serine protease n=1 Tax=Rothia sp. LK2588 TaxID=3114369 RepID=UPI0034CDECF6
MSQHPWDQQSETPRGHYGSEGEQPTQPFSNVSAEHSGHYAQYGQGENPGYQQYNPGGYAQHPYAQAPQYAEPRKKKHGTGTVLGAALLAALVGSGVATGVNAIADKASPAAASHGSTTSSTTIVNNTDSVNEITAAAAKATPSVVTISVNAGQGSGSGSGVVLDDQGHILTNTHVVTLDGQASKADIEVQLSDAQVRKAQLVGTDPTSDLAVIKVDTQGLNLTPATLGDSEKLNVGDAAIAIGAPLGLQNTVTDGIISTLSRTIEIASSAPNSDTQDSAPQQEPFGSQDSPFQFQLPHQQPQGSKQSTISLNVLQTDAAVNPGNSGGALVNAKGEVVGINVAIASAGSSSSSGEQSGNIGVGFAIPVNYAKRVANDIIQDGAAKHGQIGATIATSPANDNQSQAFGDGATIRDVTPGGAADEAGLKSGDVVTSFDGRPITEAGQLSATVRQTEPGKKVKLTVQRGGAEKEIELTLGQASK